MRSVKTIHSFILLILLLVSGPVWADCTNPARPEGKIVYNADNKVAQYCDGTDWWAMHVSGSGSGCCTNPTRSEGATIYNGDHRVMQVCAGNQWEAMGSVGGTEPGDPVVCLPGTISSGGMSEAGTISNGNLNGARGIAVAGNYAYVAAYGFDRFTVIDISDPANPFEAGSISNVNLDGASGVTVAGSYAYVTSYVADSLTIIDVTDPANPSQVGTISNANLDSAWNVAVSGDYAYVTASLADSLTVIDISDPVNPSQVGTISNANMDQARGVAVAGNYAYVTANTADSLTIIDISDPANPSQAGTLSTVDLNGARGVAVAGNYAYVTALSGDAFTIVDISDPANPSQVGTISDPSLNAANGMVLAGDYAYVAAGIADSLTVIDISDPANPSQAGTITTANLDGSVGVAVAGNYAYLASSVANSLTVIDTGCTLGGGAGGGYCTNPDRPEGTMFYNFDYRVYQYCDGANWVPVGKTVLTLRDDTPDAFGFTDQTDVALSTPIESNIIQITGLTPDASVTISGDGSPQYRICTNGTSDANCDGSEVQTWITGTTTISNNEYLQLRLTSNAANSTMNSATVTVGSVNDQWDVTTEVGGPTGCPTIGDVCSDGSVYAGLSPDGNVAMYTTPADEGQFTWNNGSTNWIDTAMANNSYVTGEANTNLLVGLADAASPYAAAVYCEGLNVHGQDDWYLPARDELDVVYDSRAAIGGFNTSGAWPAGYYWSSSEQSNNRAWSRNFTGGSSLSADDKNNVGLSVRCVRKE